MEACKLPFDLAQTLFQRAALLCGLAVLQLGIIISGSGRIFRKIWLFLLLRLIQPIAVIIQITIECRHLAIRHQHQAVSNGAQQITVMGHHHQRALIILEGHGERIAHIQIQVIGWLVEQQQMRTLPREQGQHQTRLFSP